MRTLDDYCQSISRPLPFPRAVRRRRPIRPGNVLRVQRWFFWHYGVYADNGEVMVLAGPQGEGRVGRVSIWEFAREGAVQIVRVPGQTSLEETLQRALGAEGKGQYDLLTDNCEHFAMWCATGEKSSRQAALLKSALVGVGLWGLWRLDQE